MAKDARIVVGLDFAHFNKILSLLAIKRRRFKPYHKISNYLLT